MGRELTRSYKSLRSGSNIKRFGKYIKEKVRGKNLPVEIIKKEKSPAGERVIEVEGRVIGTEPKRLYEGNLGENLPALVEKEKKEEPPLPEPPEPRPRIIVGPGEEPPGERIPPQEERPAPQPERRAGQGLRLRPEVRRERPWRGELISDVGISIGKDREPIKKTIEEMIKRREVEYAREWWQDNQELIKREGYDFNNGNEKYIVDKTRTLGGFEGLGEDNDHNHLLASRYELKKDKISPDRAQIILHQIQRRKDLLEGDIDDAREAKNKRLAKSKEKELENLLGIRERLAGKISGKNLRREAKDETWMSSLRRKKTIDSKVEEKIRQMDTYETGLGNVQERFDGARKKAEEDLMVEYMEGKIKKDPNSARVWEEMERAHGRDEEVLKPAEVIREAFTRQERERGPLSDMEEGGWEVNRGRILQFFKDSGYTFNPAHMELANLKLEAMGKPFERALGGDASLVYWIYDLIFNTLLVQSEENRRQRAAEAAA